MTTALQTVKDYHRSIRKGTKEWQRLLTEDIVFQGPIKKVSGRQTYIELALGFFSMVQDYGLLRELTSEGLAVIEGVYTIAAPSGKTLTLEMAEMYEVKNDQIQDIRLYFDAEELRAELAAAKS